MATVSQEDSERKTIARCDDGSDGSFVYPALAEAATLSGIGRIKCIELISLKVALQKQERTVEFTFSRMWIVPNTVLHLESGDMGIHNTPFLLSEDRLTGEPPKVGRPLLQHM